ncbi:alpha-ketoglutarate-dependent dioxygenase AlkB [Phaeobacter piscinae]|uniref:Alpha-ketoglutarate-dependent dioxygenase AlkB n=2 Tax=Phaeobacter piscinae TaxID=1580596 RepID=A0AAN1LC24_9RHOB|nr:alpha-ketoglutarate-dependent dioxygenase AlkB [Phaeobacter piscinae]AUR37478.1 alpha-ketoglutarate-dependent dioxygenase AlkB [Phaeobacter piscinae]
MPPATARSRPVSRITAVFDRGAVKNGLTVMMKLRLRGFELTKPLLDMDGQQRLIECLRPVLRAAPLFSPEVPSGGKMSVRMTSAGDYGWVSDRDGYRYEERHPAGRRWPEIPTEILDIWHATTGLERRPDCCLINYYGEGARMGLHQDKDEADFSYPVVSISLGDDGLLRIGNQSRGGKTDTVWLNSGDVVVMGGDARLTYHGVDRIRFKSSRLLPKGGRINLTLRVVT